VNFNLSNQRVQAYYENIISQRPVISEEKRRDEVRSMALAAKEPGASSKWMAFGEDVVKMIQAHLPYIDPMKMIAEEQTGVGYNETVKFKTTPGLRAWVCAPGVAPKETKAHSTFTEFPDIEIKCFPVLNIFDMEYGVGPTAEQVAFWAIEAIENQKLGILYNLLVAAVAAGSANMNTSAGGKITQTNANAAQNWLTPRIGRKPAGWVGPQASFTPFSEFGYAYSAKTYEKLYESLGMLESYRAIPFVELIQPMDEDGNPLLNEAGTALVPLAPTYDMFLCGTNHALGGVKYAKKMDIKVLNYENSKEEERGWIFKIKINMGVVNPEKTVFRCRVNA
jgi:hypothetical protein